MKPTRKALLGVAAGVLMLSGLVGCGGGSSSTASCPKAVEALTANLKTAKTIGDVDKTLAQDTFVACADSGAWMQSARDHGLGAALATTRGSRSSVNATDALNFLCTRYDAANTTAACDGRHDASG